MSLLDRYYRVRITAADPESELTKLTFANVEITDANWIDHLTVEITIKKVQYDALKRILEKDGIHYRTVKILGFLWCFGSVRKRPVLAVGCVLFLILSCLLPRHVFFIEVSGNEYVQDTIILQQAEKCGIRFGALAEDIRSEQIKNRLLGELPELQWVGVTTAGTVVTLHVKERSQLQELPETLCRVSSVVAAHDGIVTKMQVHRGTPLIQVGQTVKAGDTLISGYTDCGRKIIAQNADGEVFAYTLRDVSAISPKPVAQRMETVRAHTCYRFRIGKKVINLCNHSGIHDATCVKMYSEDYWTLPGGYQLPVSMIKVKYQWCRIRDAAKIDARNDWLMQYVKEYLLSQMVAGEVLDESLIWNMSEDFCELGGNYACHEMIGQVKREETIEQYAENH